MPIPIINSIASWFLKKRMHQIELFEKYPAEVQNDVLLNLVNKAKNTIIGRDFGFSSIKSYEDFSKKVPVFSYENFSDKIELARKGENNIFWPTKIKWFAKSSGTTNSKSKFIPVSDESLEDCHYAAGKDLLCMYLNNNSDSQLFTGKSLRLGGSKSPYEKNGTFYGDLSAILIDNMPFWAEFSSTPSNKTSLMDDWNYKIEAIINETINENVTSLAGVPSWMLVLLNKIIERSDKKYISEIWPNLEVYFHGGVSFKPYLNQYNNILNNNSMHYYEIYNASEGFFAIQHENHSNELLLMLDYGIFYEFIDMKCFETKEEKIIPLYEVEKNKNYAILITTNAGLWRYKIGDTVKFTSVSPYKIIITGRTKHFINVFGEEVIIENTDNVINRLSSKYNLKIVDYTVAPIFMENNKKGAHEWFIEFNEEPNKNIKIDEIIDKELKKENSDYEAKRYNNFTLEKPKVIVGSKGVFMKWLEINNKLGGQNKIPRLSNNRKFIEKLIGLNN
ncbi:MAG: GH3 auxin-responsive promoter family protein [Flavobacteriaceae bacterium]|nr:GH3 auxin-responsive promoter family protein [Flavobacteriaceae bacterium]